MTRYLSVAALAAAFAIGGAWMLTRPAAPGDTMLQGDLLPGAAQAQESGDAAQAQESGDAATDISTIPEMAMGLETAPVTIIEYASFTCPHCADFHADQYQQLGPYIEDGRVRFIFREVYFDRFGLWASLVARCTDDPMRFFGITGVLYDTQRDWIGDGEPATIADNLRTVALTAGLDAATLDACFADEAKARTLIAWFEENATRDAVTATPTLFINGEKYANMAFSEMAAIIDPIIEASDWTPPTE